MATHRAGDLTIALTAHTSIFVSLAVKFVELIPEQHVILIVRLQRYARGYYYYVLATTVCSSTDILSRQALRT